MKVIEGKFSSFERNSRVQAKGTFQDLSEE